MPRPTVNCRCSMLVSQSKAISLRNHYDAQTSSPLITSKQRTTTSCHLLFAMESHRNWFIAFNITNDCCWGRRHSYAKRYRINSNNNQQQSICSSFVSLSNIVKYWIISSRSSCHKWPSSDGATLCSLDGAAAAASCSGIIVKLLQHSPDSERQFKCIFNNTITFTWSFVCRSLRARASDDCWMNGSACRYLMEFYSFPWS